MIMDLGVGYNTLKNRSMLSTNLFYARLYTAKRGFFYIKYYTGKDLITMGVTRKKLKNFTPLNDDKLIINSKVVGDVVKGIILEHSKAQDDSDRSILIKVTEHESVVLTAFLYKLESLAQQ